MQQNIRIDDFNPAVIQILKRKYNDKGYEQSEVIGEIPAIEYYHRIPDAYVPKGFHRLSVRGTDWFECNNLEELLSLCEQNREALRNHLYDKDYDQMVKTLKATRNPEDTDEFYELHSCLNLALSDIGAPTIEGFEQTLAEKVLVNHHCDVLTVKSLDEIRKQFNIKNSDEINIDLGITDEDACPIWNDFKKAFHLKEKGIKTFFVLCICENAGGELNNHQSVHFNENKVMDTFRQFFLSEKNEGFPCEINRYITSQDIDGLELTDISKERQYKITCKHYVI